MYAFIVNHKIIKVKKKIKKILKKFFVRFFPQNFPHSPNRRGEFIFGLFFFISRETHFSLGELGEWGKKVGYLRPCACFCMGGIANCKGGMEKTGEICEMLTKRRAAGLCIVWKRGGPNR